MHPVPRAEGQHLAGFHRHPAPDRRGCFTGRPRDKDGVCRHGEYGYPCQFLFAAREVQVVDLCQARPKRAAAGDEESPAALLAQRNLEPFRIAEYRGNATRHFFSPACSAAGLPELQGRHSINLVQKTGHALSIFGQPGG
jgi:hypothetical protein